MVCSPKLGSIATSVIITDIDPQLQTIRQGSKTFICISFTKLNIHLLPERVFLNFPGYSLTVTQMQANATKRLHKFRNRPHFSRDTKRIYEKICYSHASSLVSTVTLLLSEMLEAYVVHIASFLLAWLGNLTVSGSSPIERIPSVQSGLESSRCLNVRHCESSQNHIATKFHSPANQPSKV
ncbi:hypothetical protein CSKR_101325 [Clonorchis sinensis]|uniref:Uncharacterized protein n=1 Tax=Clonorchis sinensis TaxID=79923 RepID=A0A3R7DNI4_CLOSI|nr:hypothetical protein CSKR_101325 [Clonorchis sinensis]